MRNKVGLKTVAILLVIAIIASSVVVHSIGYMEKGIRESGGKGISSFVPPHLMGIASANSAECVAIIEENQTYEKAIVQRKQADLRAFQESQQGTPLSLMSFGDIVRTIPAPSTDSCGLAWDGANLWYVSWNYSNTSIHSVIYKVSSVDGTILGEWTPTVAADVVDMTWDGEYLYGVDFIDDKIYKFDPITLDIVGSIPAPSGIVGGLTWDGNYFWVTEGVTDLLYKVDSVGNVIQTYGGYGDLSMSGLAWDGENLWLELSFENCILKINPNTGEVLKTLSGGGNWVVFPGCAFDGQYLWCNWYDHNAVMSIAQIDIGERDTTEVKIGIMQALTGDLGTYGGPMTDAMKLAVKEVNENEGVLGVNFKAIVEDTQTSENLAVDAANKLVKVDKVPAIIGTTSSGSSMAILDITTGNGVIQISSSNTAPDFSTYEDNDLYFRTCPSDTLQGKAMARLAINEGYTTASTLVMNNPYGVGFEAVFKDEFDTLGGVVLESVRYDPSATIFDSEVVKACKPKPEFVMLCSYPETGSVILKSAYEKGYIDNIDWLLYEGLRDETLAEMVGKDEAGNYIIAGLKGTTPDPRVAGPAYGSFKEKYEAEYKKEVTTYCSNSYDAMALVALAIEKAGNATGTAIRDSMREIANPPGEEVTDIGEALLLIREGKDINYQGASSEITFDEDGDVPGNYCEWSIADDGSIVLGVPIEISAIKTIRIGYQPSTHQIAYMTAMDKGWWEEDLKKFGIAKITEHEFPSGPPEMIAMKAGELDVAYVGIAPPITAIDKGLDAKIVAAVQMNGSALVLLPEHAANYTSPTDLKGMIIATFPPGSIQDTILKKWLKDHGLKPDLDVEIIGMGPGEAVTAIDAGAVNGVFLPAPYPTLIEQKGTGKMVAYSGEMWPNHACCCLLVSDELIKDHPELVEQIVRTHINATEYNKEHMEEAAEIFTKKVQGSEIAIVKKSLENWDGAWISDPHLVINSTLEYVKVDYEMGYIDKLLTEDDLFDTSFYDKIMGIFDTESPANPYPSISGTHNGTITPKQTITVQKLYTYPCTGTGGHTEYAKICNDSWSVETLPWAGYNGDWHILSFPESFKLCANKTYNYEIRTSSYPQIHHTDALLTANGRINCTEFVDVNGKRYDNWIPAIILGYNVTPTPPTTGAIKITSDPTGAMIEFDGERAVGPMSITPTTITTSPGTHTIKLSQDGYQDWSTSVEVTAGGTSEVHGTLTPDPTPTPAATPTEPEILSKSSYISSLGYFHVVGEVINPLSTSIEFVKITATFYDAQKTVIGTDYTYTELDILKPNQKSPFDLSSYPDKIDPDSYKLKVSYWETDEEPFSGLKILSHSARIDDYGYHKIVGEIKNEGTNDAEFVKVVCTYYDAGGKVIGTSFTYTAYDIDVGDSAPFELSSFPRELVPANYELQVQGRQA